MHWSVIKNAEWRLSLKRVQLLHICAERLHSAFIPRLSSYFTHLAPLLHNSFQYTLSYYTLLRIMFSYWYCILQNHTFSLALHHVDGFAKKSALHFHKTFNLMQNSLPDLILYCLPNYIQTYLFVQYRKQLWMFCQKKLKNHFWIVESTVLYLNFAVLVVSQWYILAKTTNILARILFWPLFLLIIDSFV